LLFGGLHYYILTKMRAAFSLEIRPTFLLILFMGVMVTAPMISYAAERLGFETFARFLAFVGYTWMGLAFLFSAISLLIDFSRLLFFIGGLLLRKEILHLNPLWAFLLPLVFALTAGAYGFFEAQDIRTERITVFRRSARVMGNSPSPAITSIWQGWRSPWISPGGQGSLFCAARRSRWRQGSISPASMI
jgi:hypothetical protein